MYSFFVYSQKKQPPTIMGELFLMLLIILNWDSYYSIRMYGISVTQKQASSLLLCVYFLQKD